MQKEAGEHDTVGIVKLRGAACGAAALHMTGFMVRSRSPERARADGHEHEVDFVSARCLTRRTFNGNGAAFPAPLQEQLAVGGAGSN